MRAHQEPLTLAQGNGSTPHARRHALESSRRDLWRELSRSGHGFATIPHCSAHRATIRHLYSHESASMPSSSWDTSVSGRLPASPGNGASTAECSIRHSLEEARARCSGVDRRHRDERRLTLGKPARHLAPQRVAPYESRSIEAARGAERAAAAPTPGPRVTARVGGGDAGADTNMLRRWCNH